jgi:hypothetical protein
MRIKATRANASGFMDSRLLTFRPQELRIANGTEVGRGMRKRWREQPDGQISNDLRFCLVQPRAKKYFCFSEIKSVVYPLPSRSR